MNAEYRIVINTQYGKVVRNPKPGGRTYLEHLICAIVVRGKNPARLRHGFQPFYENR